MKYALTLAAGLSVRRRELGGPRKFRSYRQNLRLAQSWSRFQAKMLRGAA